MAHLSVSAHGKETRLVRLVKAAHSNQDYFRDLTPEDFRQLVPDLMDPSRDDALTVPYLGRERPVEGRAGKASSSRGREDVDVRFLGRSPSLSYACMHTSL